jgi:hypothetical protein
MFRVDAGLPWTTGLDSKAGVVQVGITPKTKNPLTIKALSISGVTWKWHVLNHALELARFEPRPGSHVDRVQMTE